MPAAQAETKAAVAVCLGDGLRGERGAMEWDGRRGNVKGAGQRGFPPRDHERVPRFDPHGLGCATPLTEIFAHEIVVAPADIDVLGHASNITFVRWIQETALAHSSAVGLDVDAYKELGAVFVIVRHEIDYMRPAMLGDVLESRTWVSSVMAAKCLRSTEIVRKADGQVLARGMTTWGFIEIATGRPKRIAQSVKSAFAWVDTRPSAPPPSVPPSTPPSSPP